MPLHQDARGEIDPEEWTAMAKQLIESMASKWEPRG
jgi:hypothetical protein